MKGDPAFRLTRQNLWKKDSDKNGQGRKGGGKEFFDRESLNDDEGGFS